MATPETLRFASAVLIGSCGRLLFQQRDNIPGIRNPGGIGLFGGHREAAETFAQCVSREVHEEIGYLIPPEGFELLARYDAPANDDLHLLGEIYLARDIPVDRLIIGEGTLLLVDRAELPDLMQRVVPSARAALRVFLDRSQST